MFNKGSNNKHLAPIWCWCGGGGGQRQKEGDLVRMMMGRMLLLRLGLNSLLCPFML